jgi:hypothetical protein
MTSRREQLRDTRSLQSSLCQTESGSKTGSSCSNNHSIELVVNDRVPLVLAKVLLDQYAATTGRCGCGRWEAMEEDVRVPLLLAVFAMQRRMT